MGERAREIERERDSLFSLFSVLVAAKGGRGNESARRRRREAEGRA